SGENIARAALELLRDEVRDKVKARLGEVVRSLGGPGGSRRAARAIVGLLEHRGQDTRQLVAAGNDRQERTASGPGLAAHSTDRACPKSLRSMTFVENFVGTFVGIRQFFDKGCDKGSRSQAFSL